MNDESNPVHPGPIALLAVRSVEICDPVHPITREVAIIPVWHVEISDPVRANITREPVSSPVPVVAEQVEVPTGEMGLAAAICDRVARAAKDAKYDLACQKRRAEIYKNRDMLIGYQKLASIRQNVQRFGGRLCDPTCEHGSYWEEAPRIPKHKYRRSKSSV